MLPSCRNMTELSSEYLAGKLSWSMRLKFRLHLMMCIHCRRYLRQFQLMLRLTPQISMDEELEEKQIDLIAQKIKQARQ
ncbi:MAG TPA: anti-sigma factor [Gammaproteobacteria bacterium]|nr:anti-sigma factor [Gammaproteobacteria bacterium]